MKITPVVLGFSVILTCSFVAGRSSLPQRDSNRSEVGVVPEFKSPSHNSCKATDGFPADSCDTPSHEISITADTARSVEHFAGMTEVGNALRSNEIQFPGAATLTVERESSNTTLRVTGIVVPNQRLIHNVSAGLEGSLRKTYDAGIGSQVRKDERLAAFYSPEFLPYANSYLVASERLSAAAQETSAGANFAAVRLRNIGVAEAQIREMNSSRQVPENIEVVSPSNGVILARTVAKGQRVAKGQELYRVVDLSSVWIIANVPDQLVGDFRPGATALVSSPETSRTLHATVADVLAEGDARSRSMQVRLEASNSDLLLRPNMSVVIELPIRNKAVVSLPQEAVLESGLHQTVFVEHGIGSFEVRKVQTGRQLGSRIEIVGGIQPGERVAAFASFLVDSETALGRERSGIGQPRRIDSFGGQP